MIDILNEMLHCEDLPLLPKGRRTHYEGSIDKTGKNADWDWFLYEDEHREWVLFEQYGAGCVFNFVQHRMPYADDPIFRFYFDGEEKPRFEIRHSQFGEKRPFVRPLADAFCGPYLDICGGTYIRVVRSFVPMPFTTHCKITCNIKLEGNHPGGWGHVIYQAFSDDVPEKSFDPKDPRYTDLEKLMNQRGRNPLRMSRGQTVLKRDITLESGASAVIADFTRGGMVSGIQLRLANFTRSMLQDVFISARWDGHGKNDFELPLGCFFGNELGYNGVSYLMSGMDADGGFYQFFPMPFDKCAELTLINRGSGAVTAEECRVGYTDEFNDLFASSEWGYFRSAPYHAKSCPGYTDSIIGEVSGEKGRVVCAVVTGYPYVEDGRADCEGDVRVHFDGLRTPQIESDGSESYACYGWGFCAPPQCNAMSGYDGERYYAHRDWSMYRASLWEGYPFLNGFRFGIESFAYNNELMNHSGAVLYYGTDGSGFEKLAEYRTDEESLTAAFEGDDDDKLLTLTGDRGKKVSLTVQTNGKTGLLLRRVSDQEKGRQMAEIYVDGEKCAAPWYNPDRNPYIRFLEDEYIIPSSMLKGKESVSIEIVPVPCAEYTSFNQFGIEVFAF